MSTQVRLQDDKMSLVLAVKSQTEGWTHYLKTELKKIDDEMRREEAEINGEVNRKKKEEWKKKQ